jgi:hypothetical protein
MVSGPSEIFPHAVRVMAFFPAGRDAPGKLRTFEYLIFIQAPPGSSAAGQRALSILRTVREGPEPRKILGTGVKPSFYAVVWTGYVGLPDGAAVPFEHPMIINYFTVEEQEVEALKAHFEARFPVRLAYLEE